jgi:hypothetical protein
MAEEHAPPARRRKYQAIGDWLAIQPGPQVALRFGEVERLLGHRLPPTAWSGRSGWWWAASRHGLWHAPGWRLEAVDRLRGIVTFVRVDAVNESAP